MDFLGLCRAQNAVDATRGLEGGADGASPIYRVSLPEFAEAGVAMVPGVDGLVVVSLDESVQRWNLEHPELAIRRGHVVLEINDKTTLEEMHQELRRGSLPRELLLSREDGGDLPPQQRWIFEKTLQHHTADAWMQRVEALDKVEGCSICLEDMAVASEAVRLPCGHCYHPRCLKNWFVRKLRCPLCNVAVE